MKITKEEIFKHQPKFLFNIYIFLFFYSWLIVTACSSPKNTITTARPLPINVGKITPQNLEDSSPEINQAISKLSHNGGGTLVIGEGSFTLKSPLKVKNNVKLLFEEKTKMNIPKNVIQTFTAIETRGENFVGEGKIRLRKELYNSSYNSIVFSNKLDVEFENQFATNVEIKPEWFGAVPDGQTDCTKAIQKAINACPTKGFVVFGQGSYIVSKGLKISKPINLRGIGKKGSGLFWYGGEEPMISFDNKNYGALIFNSIEGLSFYNETTPTVCILVKGFYTKIKDVHTFPKVGWTTFIDTNPDRSVIRLDLSGLHITSRKDGTPIKVGVNMRRGAQFSLTRSHIQDCLTGINLGTSQNGVLGVFITDNNNIFSSSWLGNDVVNVRVKNVTNLKISESAFWPNNDENKNGANQKAIILHKLEGGAICNNFFTGGGFVKEMILVKSSSVKGLSIYKNSFMRINGYAIGSNATDVCVDIKDNHIIKAVKSGVYRNEIKGTAPSVCFGNLFITSNNKPTVISKLGECDDNKSIQILINDPYTSFDFSTGNIKCADNIENWKPSGEGILQCVYMIKTQKWYCIK